MKKVAVTTPQKLFIILAESADSIYDKRQNPYCGIYCKAIPGNPKPELLFPNYDDLSYAQLSNIEGTGCIFTSEASAKSVITRQRNENFVGIFNPDRALILELSLTNTDSSHQTLVDISLFSDVVAIRNTLAANGLSSHEGEDQGTNKESTSAPKGEEHPLNRIAEQVYDLHVRLFKVNDKQISKMAGVISLLENAPDFVDRKAVLERLVKLDERQEKINLLLEELATYFGDDFLGVK